MPWVNRSIPVRVAYIFFSLGYGKDMHPPGLLDVSKIPYHRRCVAPRCGSTFLLERRSKTILVGSCENSGQRLGSLLPGGCRIVLPDGSVYPMGHSLRVSAPWTSFPQNAH